MTSPDGDGWTLTTLREHIAALLTEMDRRYQQRYEAQREALEAALLAAKEASQAAMQAAKEAVTKAELSVDARLELLNELRIGVPTKGDVEAVDKLVSDLTDRINRSEGKSTGLNTGWVILLGAVGTIAAVIAVVVSLKP